MKIHLLPCTLLCMLLTAMPGISGPEDTFYEANLSLTRAARLEKEGDYKAALESSRQAARLLQSLSQSSPDWNPSWVKGKMENAALIQERVEPLAQKAPASKKEDYSLKPGEWRDVTVERAYKAHQQQKLVVRQATAPSPAPAAVREPVSSGRRVEIRTVRPGTTVVPPRAPLPTRVPPPRSERDGRFRIGS